MSQAGSGYRWVFTEQTCAAAVLYLFGSCPQCPVCMWSCAGEENVWGEFQESRIVFCVDLALSISSRGAFGTRHWQDAAVTPLVLSLDFTMHKHSQRMRKLWIPFSCFLNMPLTWSLWRMLFSSFHLTSSSEGTVLIAVSLLPCSHWNRHVSSLPIMFFRVH